MPDEELDELEEEEQVYEQEVLIDDSSLNAIATAIRRKNGLARTYKPREMAPAIRAVMADAPDTREYTVTVIQSDHQTIKVKQYLGGEKMYNESFTVSEPFWKAQAIIEADPGYIAGALNYPDEITIDRDYVISASPATQIVVPPDESHTVYWAYNAGDAGYGQKTYLLRDDGSVLNRRDREENKPKPTNRIHYTVTIDTDLYSATMNTDQVPANRFLRVFNDNETIWRNQGDQTCTDLTFDLKNKGGLTSIWRLVGTISTYLEYINFVNWDTSEVTSIDKFCDFGNYYMKGITGLNSFNTDSLTSLTNFVTATRYMDSLDLSQWSTPVLVTATNIFTGDYARILDISNWNTSTITSFSAGIRAITKAGVLYPAYLIMDKDEVKFSGNYIFSNIANCKYLVPENRVQDYKQHPNWQSRASQIDSITNYTINRANGQITIVPNY